MAPWSRLRLLPALGWTALILFVASRPKAFFLPPEAPVVYGLPRWMIQYLYHVSAFLVLAVLVRRGVEGRSDPGHRADLAALLGALAVSVGSEVLQAWIPTRTPAARDLALDLAGALVGLALLRTLPRRDAPRLG
jgi:VanZ family protein